MLGKKEGFTLIELIISLTLFLILITGLNMLLTRSLKELKFNQLRMKKLIEVNGVLEYLKSLDFNNTCLNTGLHVCNGTCCGSFNSSSLKYQVILEASDLKKITVWKELNHNNQNYNETLSVLKRRE